MYQPGIGYFMGMDFMVTYLHSNCGPPQLNLILLYFSSHQLIKIKLRCHVGPVMSQTNNKFQAVQRVSVAFNNPQCSDNFNQLFAVYPYFGIYITQPVRTLFLFKSIWIRPQGSQGCQKIRFFFALIKLLSFCANIAPKKAQTSKNHQN